LTFFIYLKVGEGTVECRGRLLGSVSQKFSSLKELNISSNLAHSPLITVARSGTIWTRQLFSWFY